MRRALDYARASASRWPSTARTTPWPGAATCTKVSGRAGSASPAMPAEAEEVMVARDIALVRLTGRRCTSSTCPPRARWRWSGRPRRGGLAGHGRGRAPPLSLTDAAVAGYDPVFKVNPPLRTATTWPRSWPLCDGTIDAIATDHAPHAPEAKDAPFDQAPPGMLGLETALALAWTELRPPGPSGCSPC